MQVRRLSTHSLALRAAAHLDAPAKFLETLNRPQLRDILETLDTHEAALFFILGPVQFFKTLVGQLYLIRCHLLRPTKIGWYGPTRDFVADFADTKLNALLDRLPEVNALAHDRGNHDYRDPDRPLDPRKITKLRREYIGGAEHRLLSANTENDRTGKTFEKVLCDEPHLYDPGWLEQIFNRTKDYETTSVRLLMSTGMTRGQDVKGGEAAKIWDQTDQRLWHCRCPACQKYFEPRYLHREKPDDKESPIIGGLLYDRTFLPNGLPHEAAIAARLRYKCPRCGSEKFPDNDGTRLALNGDYARPRGLYVIQNDSPKSRHFGWNFSAIAGRAWLPIVMDWEHAQLALSRGDLEPLGKVIREHFGGVWNRVEYLKERRTRPPGGYRMADLTTWGRSETGDQKPETGNSESLGSPRSLRSLPLAPWSKQKSHECLKAWWPKGDFDPAGDPYLIATIDVHQDWFRLVIRFWNRLSQSRLLYTSTEITPGRIAEICDLLGVRRDRTVIDEGHKPQQVRIWCAQFGWRALRGDGKEKDYPHPDGVKRVIAPAEYLDPFQGTAHQGRAKIVKNYFAKWSCLARLILLRQLTANDGTPLFTAADDAPDWYFKELDAYVAIPKFEKGIETTEYQSSGPDHAADCEIEGIAVASALNLTGAESLEPAPVLEMAPAA